MFIPFRHTVENYFELLLISLVTPEACTNITHFISLVTPNARAVIFEVYSMVSVLE